MYVLVVVLILLIGLIPYLIILAVEDKEEYDVDYKDSRKDHS